MLAIVNSHNREEYLNALRNTWLSSVPDTLDYRVFRGRGATREPLSDEVFLDRQVRTVTDLNATERQARGVRSRVPCVTPVPESGMLKLEPEPLEVMLTLPLAAPLAVGLKSTVKDVLWPAVNVKGKASPLKLNPVPLTAAAEIVRLDPPVLVKVSD